MWRIVCDKYCGNPYLIRANLLFWIPFSHWICILFIENNKYYFSEEEQSPKNTAHNLNLTREKIATKVWKSDDTVLARGNEGVDVFMNIQPKEENHQAENKTKNDINWAMHAQVYSPCHRMKTFISEK